METTISQSGRGNFRTREVVDDLIGRFEHFITSIANTTYLSSHVLDVEDLKQAGRLAVALSAPKHNASFGSTFNSYIKTAIRRAIYREAEQYCGIFSLPSGYMSQAAAATKLHRTGKNDEEVAVVLSERFDAKINSARVRDLRFVYGSRFKSPPVDDDTVLSLDSIDLENFVKDLGLSSEERLILSAVIINQKSIKDAAEACQRSEGYVRRMASIVKRKIREYVYDA